MVLAMALCSSICHKLVLYWNDWTGWGGFCIMEAFFHPSYTHTHVRLTALFPGLPRWAGTRKVKPIWILLKQETVSGCSISWAVCKSAPRSRQRATPAPTTPKLWTLIILPQQVNLVVNKTCPWSSFVVYTYDTWCSITKRHWYNVPCTCRLTGWAKKIWTFLRVDT